MLLAVILCVPLFHSTYYIIARRNAKGKWKATTYANDAVSQLNIQRAVPHCVWPCKGSISGEEDHWELKTSVWLPIHHINTNNLFHASESQHTQEATTYTNKKKKSKFVHILFVYPSSVPTELETFMNIVHSGRGGWEVALCSICRLRKSLWH